MAAPPGVGWGHGRELMAKDLDTGEMVPLETAATAALERRFGSRSRVAAPAPRAAKRLSAAEETLLLPATLVPQITRLAFSGAPLVGAQVSIEPTFSIRDCTHVTRWRRMRATRDKPVDSAEAERDEQGVVAFVGESYLVAADDLGCVLVAEVMPTGPTGARGLAGTATTSVVALAPQLHRQLCAALMRASACFEMELVVCEGGAGSRANGGRAAAQPIVARPAAPAYSEAAPSAERAAPPAAPRTTRRVRLLLSAKGVQIRTLGRSVDCGAARASRSNATLAFAGFTAETRARAPPASPRRLLLSLARGAPALELLAGSAEERMAAVLAIRAFACLGDARTALGAALWPHAAHDDEAAVRVRAPALGGAVRFSGQPLVGCTLCVQLPAGLEFSEPSRAYASGGDGHGGGPALRVYAGSGVPASALHSVQVAWRRSRVNAPPLSARRGAHTIEGARGASYCLTADDVGCFVSAEVSPVGADGSVGVCGAAVTPAPVGLASELAQRLETARETGEARFAALDVSALSAGRRGSGGRAGAHAPSGAEGGGRQRRSMHASLTRTVAASWMGQGAPPDAERTLLINAHKSKLRFGRRTLAKVDLNEATDARIVGASEAQTEAAAAAADSAAGELLRHSVPMCVRMSPSLAFDLLMPTAHERDAAALILRMFARQRCDELGLRWWGAQADSDSDEDEDEEDDR